MSEQRSNQTVYVEGLDSVSLVELLGVEPLRRPAQRKQQFASRPSRTPDTAPADSDRFDAYLEARTDAFRDSLRALRSLPDWIEDAMAEHGVALPNEVKQHLALINRQAQRLDQLAQDTETFERAERKAYNARLVDLSIFISKIIHRYNVNEIWNFDVDLHVTDLVVDADLLDSALSAMIENACIHGAEPGGFVRITVAMDGNQPTISVSDDGPGIDPAISRKIGTAFNRGASEDEGGGSGLGLTTAAMAAERLGGSLQVAPAIDGCGTVAKLTLGASTVLDANPYS